MHLLQALSVLPVMLKRVSTSLSAFVVLASKIWAFVVYVFKKQTRAVRKDGGQKVMTDVLFQIMHVKIKSPILYHSSLFEYNGQPPFRGDT